MWLSSSNITFVEDVGYNIKQEMFDQKAIDISATKIKKLRYKN